MQGTMKEFTDMKEWQDYVFSHMNEAERRDEMFCVTIRTSRGEVIAKWNKEGSGQVWEKRSKERLNA